MAKFKMRFKLTGLEVEIEGDRQDANQLSNAISRQLGGMLSPVTNVAALGSGESPVIDVDAAPAISSGSGSRPKRRSTSKGNRGGGVEPSEAVDFRNDISTWGGPKQSWTTANKSLWALHVITQQTDHKELSVGVIAATFNKHFRQSGNVRPSNISRDFGKLKTNKSPAWVNEDTTVDPSKWFLTDEGVKQALLLVAEAKGGGSND